MRYLTIAEFAAVARTNESTVRYWRHIGHGPSGFKLGRKVLYLATEVETWIEAERATQNGNSAA